MNPLLRDNSRGTHPYHISFSQLMLLVLSPILKSSHSFVLIRYTLHRNTNKSARFKNIRNYFQLNDSHRNSNNTTKTYWFNNILNNNMKKEETVPTKRQDEIIDDYEDDECCILIDEFGCEAVENTKITSYKTVEDCEVSINSCVRLQNQPDLADLSTKDISEDEVWNVIKEVRSKMGQVKNANLYERTWERVDDSSNEIPDEKTFSVMQLNTLAEGLSCGPNSITPFSSSSPTRNKAKNCYGGFINVPQPELCLDFNLRRWRLIELILSQKADLLALQEVDRYYGFFKPILEAFGYESIFIPKPLSPGVNLGWYSDGTALFWNKDFKLTKKKMSGFECGSQVYLIALLKHIPTGKEVIVSATHLKAGSDGEEIRSFQAKELIKEVHSFHPNDAPIIIMGDFNSEPTAECIQTTLQTFTSAYPFLGEYDYTTWKIRDCGVTKRISDYIFYEKEQGVECTHLLSMPQELEDSFLPGFRHPSDHLNIAAKFRFL